MKRPGKGREFYHYDLKETHLIGQTAMYIYQHSFCLMKKIKGGVMKGGKIITGEVVDTIPIPDDMPLSVFYSLIK